MTEANAALERLLEENKGLALFASAVASACFRIELESDPVVSAAMQAGIDRFLEAAEAASHPLASAHALSECSAAARLLREMLAEQRRRGPIEPTGPIQ